MLAELTGAGRGAEFGMAGAAPGGGRGADVVGGLGTELRDDSGSDVYDESGFAVILLDHFFISYNINEPPVSTPPPLFLSFGIPPANSPPS